MTIETIARVCHEANRALCEASGDNSQKTWEEAETWQHNSAIEGVKYKLLNPKSSPEDQHQAWCDFKVKDGWVKGDVKDAEKKTHHCLVPYHELPLEQRYKDHVFVGVVNSLKGFLPVTDLY